MKAKLAYTATREFERDIARLQKRFPSLKEDLEIAKGTAIDLYHRRGIDSGSIFRVQGFPSEQAEIYKLKKFACRSLKGRGAKSGIRMMYAFFPDAMKVALLEIYFKGDKAKEDRKRIGKFLKNTPKFKR